MSKYCPHCNEEIDHLKYTADYTEYGSEWGTCDLDGGDWDTSDRDPGDSENENTEYQCPNCEHDIDIDELLDELGDDDEEDSEDEYESNEESEGERESVVEDVNARIDVTDGGQEIINRSISNTTGPITSYRISKTIKCPVCSINNFTENDSVIICIKCNHEILIN